MVAVCIQACVPASVPDMQAAWLRLAAVMPGRHPHCCQGCDNEVSVHKCEMKRICSSWSDTKYGAWLFTINGGWGRTGPCPHSSTTSRTLKEPLGWDFGPLYFKH